MSDLGIPSADARAVLFATKAAKPVTKNLSQEFETVFLTQFVDEMMKTVGDRAFGGAKQAEMWRSFLSEAVAEKLVEQGGFGFGQSVQDVVSAYQKADKLNQS
jgi:Rod binding domain-containing protein